MYWLTKAGVTVTDTAGAAGSAAPGRPERARWPALVPWQSAREGN